MLLKHLLLELSPYNNPVRENAIYSFSIEEDTERLERLCHWFEDLKNYLIFSKSSFLVSKVTRVFVII